MHILISAILGNMGNSPTFFERFENTLDYLLSVYMQIQSLKQVTELFRERHGRDFADIEVRPNFPNKKNTIYPIN